MFDKKGSLTKAWLAEMLILLTLYFSFMIQLVQEYGNINKALSMIVYLIKIKNELNYLIKNLIAF